MVLRTVVAVVSLVCAHSALASPWIYDTSTDKMTDAESAHLILLQGADGLSFTCEKGSRRFSLMVQSKPKPTTFFQQGAIKLLVRVDKDKPLELDGIGLIKNGLLVAYAADQKKWPFMSSTATVLNVKMGSGIVTLTVEGGDENLTKFQSWCGF